MFEDTDVCANCECLLADDCCGSREPYVMDGIRYCCEACAVEEECTCGCQESARAGSGEGDKDAAQPPGPILAR